MTFLPGRIQILFFLAILVLAGNRVSAQDKDLFISITSGPSIPVGQYHSKNLNNGSFTTTGYFLRGQVAWFFRSKLGVGISGSMQQHPVDVQALGYEEVKADPFLENIVVRSEAYLVMTGMAGLYYRNNLLPKLHYQAHIGGGMMYGKTPWKLYKQEFFLVGLQYGVITSAKDWNLAGKAGLGFRYDISPCFGLIFDSEVNYSTLTFSFDSSTGTRVEKRQILFINTGLGLEFDL